MSTQNNNIDIFTDEEVFNYVAGRLSDNHKASFEERLASDTELQQAVENEKALRETIVGIESEENAESPISENNLSLLFEKIDEQERENASKPSNVTWIGKRWAGVAAMAASVAVVAVIVVNMNSPQEYYLRSSPPETLQTNYQDLVESQRVAQILPNQSTTYEELTALFEEYNLVALSKSGDAWLVTSGTRIDDEQLISLKQDSRIKEANLVSHDANSQGKQ